MSVSPKIPIFRPVVIFEVSVPSLSAGGVHEALVFEVPKDYVAEVFSIFYDPPTDPNTLTVEKIDYITVKVNGQDIATIRASAVQLPMKKLSKPGLALEYSIAPPLLHWNIVLKRRIPVEVCAAIKLDEQDKFYIEVRAKTGVAVSNTSKIYVLAAFCKKDVLKSIVGLDRITYRYRFKRLEHEEWTTIDFERNIDEWTTLPGGLNQGIPNVMPFVVHARNKDATTPNVEYFFERDKVLPPGTELFRDYRNVNEAIIIDYMGVIPHDNLSKVGFKYEYLTGPEPVMPIEYPPYVFRPPMLYDASYNIENPGPVDVPITEGLILKTRGGVYIKDNGSSIPSESVEIMVWGKRIQW